MECRSSCARQLRVVGAAVVFFEATELCRRKAANLAWAFTRARNAPTLFFFFFFSRSHTRRAEELLLESCLHHKHTVFAGKHSILFAGNIDDAFGFLFSFFSEILTQFLLFAFFSFFSFCFDKMFSQCIKKARRLYSMALLNAQH